MKAILVSAFGEPSVLEYRDVPSLERGPGQILVRLHAAGVNPFEAYIRAGKYAKLPSLPYTPGVDGAGIVEAADDSELIGKRVYVNASLTGTYAEHTLCEPNQIHPLPHDLTFEQGAAIGAPYGTASLALFNRGSAEPGETVLIHGASGGVGMAALQLANRAGLRVFGTAGTMEGVEMLLEKGAARAFDHHHPDYLDRIKEAAGERGIDLIIEMLANVNLGKDLTLLGQRGRVVVVGSRGPVEIDPRNLMMRVADIRGMTLFAATAEDLAIIHRNLGAGLVDQTLRPVVGHTFPLADAPRAHLQIMAPGALGKIVLTM